MFSALPRTKCLPLLLSYPETLNQLKQIHAQLLTNGLHKDPQFLTKLLENYCKSSSSEALHYARLIFYKQIHCETSSKYMVNIILKRFPPEEAIISYTHYCPSPDKLTFTIILGACARISALLIGKQIHCQIVKTKYSMDPVVLTTAIHFYCNCKEIKSACQVFDAMPQRSSASWNAMICGYCSLSHEKEALLLFKEMVLRNEEGNKPNDITITGVVSACARLLSVTMGSSIHGYIIKLIHIEENIFVGTGLVDMYSKCGCLGKAFKMFDEMTEKNILTWTAMISGLAINGRGKEAIELINAMDQKGIVPNVVTFTSLLCACRHSGLVKEGMHLFNNLSRHIVPTIQHYGCVADLLGRSGMVEEAYDFILKMPIKADAIIWRTLLAACGIHGRVELGEKVWKVLLDMSEKPEYTKQSSSSFSSLIVEEMRSSEDYIALSNTYASSKRWEDVCELREMMRVKSLKKNTPGLSLVEITV